MAENNNPEETKAAQGEQENLVDFSGMDGDDVVSLSDEELDNILNTAEISDTPIADIDIDIDGGEAVVSGPDASAAPVSETVEDSRPLPEEPPVQDEPAASEEQMEEVSLEESSVPGAPLVEDSASAEPAPEGGFFEDDSEDETIALSSSDLDNILDGAASEPDALQPEEPISPEAPVLGGDEVYLDAAPLDEPEGIVVEDAPLAMSSESASEGEDDDVLVLDDEELILDEGDALIVEEAPVAQETPSAVPEDSPADIVPETDMEEVTIDIEEPPAEEVPPPAGAEPDLPAAVEDLEEEDNPIVTVSGNDLDEMVAAEGGEVPETSSVSEESAPAAEEQVLEEFVIEEEIPLVAEEPIPAEEEASVLVEEPVAAEEEASVLVEEPVAAEEEVSVLVEEPVAAEEEASVLVEEPVLAEEEASVLVEEPVLAEEPAAAEESAPLPEEPLFEDEPLIAEEEILISDEDLGMSVEQEASAEPEPVAAEAPAMPDFQREAETSLAEEEEEILMIQEEPETEEEVPEEVSFMEVSVSEPAPAPLPAASASEPEPAAVPVVDEEQIVMEEEPMEIIDDEVIFSEEEKLEPEPAAELISDSDISEMTRESAPAAPEAEEPAQPESAAAFYPDGENVQGLTENTKEDMKKVLGYLDGLFDDLPEDKVKEFANSEYYDIYNKLFKELGL